MNKTILIPLVGMAALALMAGCKEQTPQVAEQPAAQAQQQSAQQGADTSKSVTGTVVETMDTQGYTYVQVDTGEEKIWAAAPKFNVQAGDSVIVPEGMIMTDYHSNSLDRDFEQVFFVNSIMVGGEQQPSAAGGTGMPQGHPPIDTSAAAPGQDIDFTGIEKAGQTVQDVYTSKDQLTGQEITVRGKVVKVNPAIMGTNWIHVQDGTGSADSKDNDLTVTSDAIAEVGDTVLVKGVLVTDKDFGSGYQYAVILENAEVTVE